MTLLIRNPLFALCCAVFASKTNAASYVWSIEADFPKEMALEPGDTVLIKAGDYSDVETRFTGGGHRTKPAIVRAEIPGTVRFYGAIQF
jgi:hypothetical protein|tara:strand:+ start:2137 stop:2403 length:267 start_codon:yes stop_codon:yes gene_type:complete